MTFSGPNHICTKNEDCVDNADCVPVGSLKPTKDIAHLFQPPDLNICRCQEGYMETGATCGGKYQEKNIFIKLKKRSRNTYLGFLYVLNRKNSIDRQLHFHTTVIHT